MNWSRARVLIQGALLLFAAQEAQAAPAPAALGTAQDAPRQAHLFDDLALSPDGAHVASIEHDNPLVDGQEPVHALVIRPIGAGGGTVTIALPCPVGPDCLPSDPAFSPDGKHLAFALKRPGDTRRYLYEVGVDGAALTQRLAFDGVVGGLRYGADGTLAFLAIQGAHKEAGAVQAGAAPSGEIGVAADEQRIAVLGAAGSGQQGSGAGSLRFVSPANLYVYEFDWRPNGSGFVATAAPGNGDNQWWVARLWSFGSDGASKVLYSPPAKQQLADPVVSPDGRSVAFIGGIMSDFGSTGGDAFRLSLDTGSRPVNLTPGIKATVTSLDWSATNGLLGTSLKGSDTELLALAAPSATPKRLWSGPDWLAAGGWNLGLLTAGATSVAIHQSFTRPPEIEAGPIGQWQDITRVNQGLAIPVTARSITWKSDGFSVQGWLLQPTGRQPTGLRPMITEVHGGPSAATTPQFLTEQHGRWLLDAGYDLFLPNPRGSYGQGEAFTQANVRDFGHGDLRDILHGVDAALVAAAVDPKRLGLMGYSYGGYMTMWTVTQTSRFRAAVAGAGVSDWQSYYGENGIDQWMIPFFGASVYDDPAVYAKSSPITYIKHVHTPTFIYVGDRDVECPMPQSQEMWHALETLGVPTEFVVYPGQGHGMRDAKAIADSKARTLAWFARWLRPG